MSRSSTVRGMFRAAAACAIGSAPAGLFKRTRGDSFAGAVVERRAHDAFGVEPKVRRAPTRYAARRISVVGSRENIGRRHLIADDDWRSVVPAADLHTHRILVLGTDEMVLAHIGQLRRGNPRRIAFGPFGFDV